MLVHATYALSNVCQSSLLHVSQSSQNVKETIWENTKKDEPIC